eukprot:Gb_14886 [translate_table: standard]
MICTHYDVKWHGCPVSIYEPGRPHSTPSRLCLAGIAMGFASALHQCSKPNVLVLAFPSHGNINPMLQFSKTLAAKGLLVTFVTTEFGRKRILEGQDDADLPPKSLLPIRYESISDGLPLDFDRSKNVDMFWDQLSKVGRLTLTNLIERLNAQGTPTACIVYNCFLVWVPHVVSKFNIPLAFFWTQSSAVYSIYYHFGKGLKKFLKTENTIADSIAFDGFPDMSVADLPSFLQPSNPYENLLQYSLEPFINISEATWILGNSFQELENKEISSMRSMGAAIRPVGPLIPSAFLDGRDRSLDNAFGTNLCKSPGCLDWLNTKTASTVVYVSFGSVALLSREQNHEIAHGLRDSGHSFLWVIRPTDSNGGSNEEILPEGFLEETRNHGLVVPWSPQLQVLSHPSVGSFMTHCGWNSTLESLSMGVPTLAVPQWTDQTTNSKYIAEVWKTGLRLNKREDGVVAREEVERCIRKVMEGEHGFELRKNALKWKNLAREAMGEGGSSNKNIEEFVNDVVSRASSIEAGSSNTNTREFVNDDVARASSIEGGSSNTNIQQFVDEVVARASSLIGG